MGLDMYLTKRTWVGAQYDHRNMKVEIKITKDDKKLAIDPKRISYIEKQVGYWRKANAIHKWFVDHVQDGKDECQTSSFSWEQLKELLDLCILVKEKAVLVEGLVHNGTTYENGVAHENMELGKTIDNAEEIAALLPTESGFFFGSTEYNEWYLQDVQETIDIISKLECEEGHETADYQYHASW